MGSKDDYLRKTEGSTKWKGAEISGSGRSAVSRDVSNQRCCHGAGAPAMAMLEQGVRDTRSPGLRPLNRILPGPRLRRKIAMLRIIGQNLSHCPMGGGGTGVGRSFKE